MVIMPTPGEQWTQGVGAVCALFITSDESLIFQIFHGFIVIAVLSIIKQRKDMAAATAGKGAGTKRPRDV